MGTTQEIDLEQDALFVRFVQLFKQFFYQYRYITWMVEVDPNSAKLHPLFYYCWENDVPSPKKPVLMEAIRFIIRDEMPVYREVFEDHVAESFAAALEELRVAEHKPNKKKAKESIAKFPSPPDLCWGEVSMAFISDEEIQVRARHQIRKYRFDQIGFKNKKNGKPNILWWLLRALAEKGGELSWGNMSSYGAELNSSQVQSNVKRLRKILREFMGIEDDPFEPYKTVKAYQTKFVIIGDANTLLDSEDEAAKSDLRGVYEDEIAGPR